MDASFAFMIAGITIACLMTGMTLYPILQAFGYIACNCDKEPEDKWSIIKS